MTSSPHPQPQALFAPHRLSPATQEDGGTNSVIPGLPVLTPLQRASFCILSLPSSSKWAPAHPYGQYHTSWELLDGNRAAWHPSLSYKGSSCTGAQRCYLPAGIQPFPGRLILGSWLILITPYQTQTTTLPEPPDLQLLLQVPECSHFPQPIGTKAKDPPSPPRSSQLPNPKPSLGTSLRFNPTKHRKSPIWSQVSPRNLELHRAKALCPCGHRHPHPAGSPPPRATGAGPHHDVVTLHLGFLAGQFVTFQLQAGKARKE